MSPRVEAHTHTHTHTHTNKQTNKLTNARAHTQCFVALAARGYRLPNEEPAVGGEEQARAQIEPKWCSSTSPFALDE